MYAPVLGFDFVSLDDRTFVVNNPIVNQGLGSEALRRAFTSVHSSNWIPLTWLSHAADVSLFGLNSGSHHAVNVLLHALNSCLLFGALRRLTGPNDLWKCAGVAAFFALHPAHVESVAWIAERKGLLSTTFGWLALWSYADYARRPSRARLALVAGWMASSLLAKAMFVTLPLLLLLLDRWPLGRASVETRARLWAEKGPLFALTGVAAALALWAQSSGPALQGLEAVGLDDRLANAALGSVRYVGLLLWPVGLSPLYPRLPAETLSWIGPAGASLSLLLAVTVWAATQRHRRPALWVGWAFTGISLLPVIGIVQIGTQSIADRYTYVPFVGLLIALAWGFDSARGGSSARWRLAVAGVLLLVCTGLSRAQLEHWRDSTSLWERAVAVTPSAIAHSQLSNQLLHTNRLEAALVHARRSVEIDPDAVQGHHNLGSVLMRQGRTDAAGDEFLLALEIDVDYAPSQLSHAVVLYKQGEYAQAVDWFERAFEQRPQYERVPDTVRWYADSLRREVRSGKVELAEVRRDQRRALELRPGWTEVAETLAWMLATHPKAGPEDGREAVVLVEQDLVELSESRRLDILAAAHATAGDFEAAVSMAERALRRARAAGQVARLESWGARLERYRAGERTTELPGS